MLLERVCSTKDDLIEVFEELFGREAARTHSEVVPKLSTAREHALPTRNTKITLTSPLTEMETSAAFSSSEPFDSE